MTAMSIPSRRMYTIQGPRRPAPTMSGSMETGCGPVEDIPGAMDTGDAPAVAVHGNGDTGTTVIVDTTGIGVTGGRRESRKLDAGNPDIRRGITRSTDNDNIGITGLLPIQGIMGPSVDRHQEYSIYTGAWAKAAGSNFFWACPGNLSTRHPLSNSYGLRSAPTDSSPRCPEIGS